MRGENIAVHRVLDHDGSNRPIGPAGGDARGTPERPADRDAPDRAGNRNVVAQRVLADVDAADPTGGEFDGVGVVLANEAADIVADVEQVQAHRLTLDGTDIA